MKDPSHMSREELVKELETLRAQNKEFLLFREAAKMSGEHLAFFHRFAESSTQGLGMADLNGVITYANPALARITGIETSWELIGRKVVDFLAPEDALSFETEVLAQVLKEGQCMIERPIRRVDGSLVPALQGVFLIRDSKGAPICFATVITDISQHKQAEDAALKASEERYQSLAGNIPGIVYRCANDADWTMEYISGEVEKTSGYPSSDFINNKVRSFGSIIHPEDRDMVSRAVQDGVDSGKPFTLEYRLLGKNGRVKWVHEKGKGIFGDNGKLLWLDGVMIDITKRKIAEEWSKDYLSFLESLETISRIMVKTTDLEPMMHDVLEAVLSMFDCDRAYLLSPCDPGAASVRVPMECTRGRYPGAAAAGQELPVDAGVKKIMSLALEADGPVRFGPDSPHTVPTKSAKNFHVRSILAMALYPKTGKPWLFGLHQCSFPRTWTRGEGHLFKEIGNRLGDALSSLFFERNLRDSEVKLRTIFNAVDNVSFVLTDGDPKLPRITEFSPGAGRLFGYTREEAVGKPVLMLHLPGEEEQLPRRLKAMEESKKGFSSEYVLERRSGETFPALFTAYPIFDSRGRLTGTLETAIDITVRKRAEEELRNSRNFLQTIIDMVPVFLFCKDREGRYLMVNRRFSEYLGSEPEEILGKTVQECWPLKDAEYFHRIDLELMETDGSREYEYGMKHVRRGIVPGVISKACFHNADGSVGGLVGIFFDLSEQKQAEQKLLEAKEEAEEANRAKSTFLANVSHEIRTPLNAVIGFSELLASLVTDSRHKSYLEAIKTAGKSLLSVINDILDLSKIEAGKMEFRYAPVLPVVLFDEIRQVFRLKTSEKNLEFRLDIDPELPRVLLLDEARLRQVLLNIVGNGVKFTETGRVVLSARGNGTAREEGGLDLRIAVEDTGIGIPAGQLETIFDSFQQQSNQDSRKYGGTGLGLTISRRLVEMMGGRLSVKSTPGEGSRFEILLEGVQKASLDKIILPEDADGQAGAYRFSFQKGKVLVVDDVESNRDLLREWLTRANLEVAVAADGKEALETVSSFGPDIVLMDIRMPVPDGIRAASRLKEDAAHRHIPVIALTADSPAAELPDSRGAGFEAFLVKPVDIKKLFRLLARYFTPAPGQWAAAEAVETVEAVKVPAGPAPEGITDLPALLERLGNEVLPEAKKMRRIGRMNKVKQFGESLKALGGEFSAVFLLDIGAALVELAENYDIANINKTLDRLPGLVDTLAAAAAEDTGDTDE